jgi:hypothetical protein
LAACHGRPDAMQGLGHEAHIGAREEGKGGIQLSQLAGVGEDRVAQPVQSGQRAGGRNARVD